MPIIYAILWLIAVLPLAAWEWLKESDAAKVLVGGLLLIGLAVLIAPERWAL